MHQKREKSNEKYSRLIDQASGDEREFLIHEAMNVRDEEDDQILNLESISLLQKAKYLSVPIPPSDDNISWERGQSPRTRRLTVYAQSELRHAISSEKIDKWRVAAFRLKELALPIIAVLGAIWGALRGISALRSK
jgi:hypothetical protein